MRFLLDSALLLLLAALYGAYRLLRFVVYVALAAFMVAALFQ